MTTSITATILNERFLEAAAQNEEEARRRFGFRPGRYRITARQHGALQTAVRFIGDGKSNKEGFLRLFCRYKETGDESVLALTLEHLFLSFAEQYGTQFPELFPEHTVKVARAALAG